MDAPDREETLKELLNAGTATRVEEVLDDAGIRLERSGLELGQIQEFWHHLYDHVDGGSRQKQSRLVLHQLVGYARSSIRARANR